MLIYKLLFALANEKRADFRSQTDQSVQQLKLKWGDAAAKLGSKGAGLLATL